MSAPSVAPAPGLLSTTMGWPSALEAPSAAARAIRSLAPPAEKGTTRRIGLAGQACAAAPLAARRAARPARRARRREGCMRCLQECAYAGKYRHAPARTERPRALLLHKQRLWLPPRGPGES